MFALVLMQLAASDLSQPTHCTIAKVARFEREADLPNDAMVAFGAPMAEKGQPFQSTDVITTPQLPIYRFIHAEQQGCELIVTTRGMTAKSH